MEDRRSVGESSCNSRRNGSKGPIFDVYDDDDDDFNIYSRIQDLSKLLFITTYPPIRFSSPLFILTVNTVVTIMFCDVRSRLKF